MRAAVDGLEHRATGAAGPGYGAIHGVDSAQAGGGARLLHLPGRLRRGRGLGGSEGRNNQKRNQAHHLHGTQYRRAPCRSARESMAIEVARRANSAAVNAKAAPGHSGFAAARESVSPP